MQVKNGSNMKACELEDLWIIDISVMFWHLQRLSTYWSSVMIFLVFTLDLKIDLPIIKCISNQSKFKVYSWPKNRPINNQIC